MADETEVEKLARAVREFEPAWKKDGFGIRGPQLEQSSSSPAPETSGGIVRREPKQPEFPRDQSTGETTDDSTTVNLYGAKDGAPYTFHLKQSSPPTPSTP